MRRSFKEKIMPLHRATVSKEMAQPFPLSSMRDNFQVQKLRELELREVGIIFGVGEGAPIPWYISIIIVHIYIYIWQDEKRKAGLTPRKTSSTYEGKLALKSGIVTQATIALAVL